MTKPYSYSPVTGIAPHVIQETISDEPLITLVNQVIKDAIQQAASDIHVEPFADACRIRYRCDGILHAATSIPSQLAVRFITRLKVMAQLDITERRLPQDGHFQLYNSDIRMNTCPTLFGEKIVLRLLNTHTISLSIAKLGLDPAQKKLFLKNITRPQGMVLLTGPTGSGKTTTLYAALNYLNSIEKNISTVEDPIEIQLAGINQVNTNSKIGLEFATVLRTLLRQDPDIIMLGEIRDPETAELAIQAAQTGHLVLATLHANNTAEAITRLRFMGIKLNDIVSSVSLIMSQRLLRKLCQHCKRPEGENSLRGTGCQQCWQGHKGRTGIYEFFPVTEKVHPLILTQNIPAIRQALKEDGLLTLYESGIKLVQQGITSLRELDRVVSP